MARTVVLDAGPLGLLCVCTGVIEADRCGDWLQSIVAGRANIVIPVVADYEVRRELIRVDATPKLLALDNLADVYGLFELEPEATQVAAEFWARLRRTGKPTAPDDDLDADALLAGVAATCVEPGDSANVATTNTRHLARFPGVDARLWSDIRA